MAGVTARELETVVRLVRAQRARTVVIGHGREAAPVAEAFAQVWDGTVLAVVGWPEVAASWLRQARRFTAGEPDAWVVAGEARGWAGMSERLRRSTCWDPGRTYGFAGTARAVAIAPPGTLEGMRGAGGDGTVWRIGRNVIFQESSATLQEDHATYQDSHATYQDSRVTFPGSREESPLEQRS